MINWNVSKEEFALIDDIAHRARRLFEGVALLDVVMSLTACHANGTPLRLKDLLEADTWNFRHDIAGIVGHINHETGQLEDLFQPRYAK